MKSSAILTLILAASLNAQTPAPATKPAAAPAAKPAAPKRAPTLANVPYGTHERQVLDFYKADSAKPAPLLFFIHGGGWVAGDKSGVGELEACLKAGISVVSINYRYSWQAQLAGVMPPVQWPLEDAARALQFVRSKAAEWNIDKTRIAASGGSAGACSSLWLAYHDDMADPKSSDPIKRESTRLLTAAVNGPQTTLDPKQMREWTPNSRYGGHAFSKAGEFKNFDDFVAARERILPWINEYSPYALVSSDDPGVYCSFGAPPAIGKDEKDPTHTANFGVKLQEHCKEKGVGCEVVYPGAADVKYKTTTEYLIAKLKEAK